MDETRSCGVKVCGLPQQSQASPSFHVIFHVLFHLILHYRGIHVVFHYPHVTPRIIAYLRQSCIQSFGSPGLLFGLQVADDPLSIRFRTHGLGFRVYRV